MAICVPKHVICNWYVPTFVAGTTPSLLQETDETRARLVAGGSFFRSVDVGPYTNNIQVTSTWEVNDGGWRVYNPGAPDFDTLLDIGRVRLSLSTGVPAQDESYTATQTYTGGSPAWTVNAIPSLRTQLSSSNLVTMPVSDIQQPWNIGLDADHLEEFDSFLAGGTGGPTTPTGLAGIRTGPAQSLIYIKNSEINSSDGSMNALQITRYWNGACWKAYDPLSPDCNDPADSIGSPPTGAPLFCELGPESDCP